MEEKSQNDQSHNNYNPVWCKFVGWNWNNLRKWLGSLWGPAPSKQKNLISDKMEYGPRTFLILDCSFNMTMKFITVYINKLKLDNLMST